MFFRFLLGQSADATLRDYENKTALDERPNRLDHEPSPETRGEPILVQFDQYQQGQRLVVADSYQALDADDEYYPIISCSML